MERILVRWRRPTTPCSGRWADDKSVLRLKSPDNGLLMSRRIYLLQGALAAGALVWTVFLLPRTSFVWWIGGNAIYSLLALVAAVRYRGRYDKVRSLAITAAVVFAGANGIAGLLACTTGGACALIVAVMVMILLPQLVIVAVGK